MSRAANKIPTNYPAMLKDIKSRIQAAYSARFRPPIPGEAGHPFRLIPATDSGRSRPPIPEHSGHPSFV